jgi:hypothetical protein
MIKKGDLFHSMMSGRTIMILRFASKEDHLKYRDDDNNTYTVQDHTRYVMILRLGLPNLEMASLRVLEARITDGYFRFVNSL